jgi:predicted aldo/keto reductase-like oxidoreductase
MKYRDFGAQGWKASVLGFGCMRLPVQSGGLNSPDIDRPEATRMIRHAIDCGVNYFDTAYSYHGGQSEVVLGDALRDGYRERVRVATKLPVWLVKEPEDFDRILGEQLERLQTDSIDCYLFHALNRKYWREVVLRCGLLDKAAAALADGRIRHLGFSFHGDFESFEEIVSGTDLWSFCQIQYNYVNVNYQAGMRGLRLAADRGLAVVVMEPLLGGKLADPPSEIRRVIEEFPLRRTAVEWALHWLWNQPEVSVVLSGMSTAAQLRENLVIACQSRVHSLGTKEEALVNELREGYNARLAIPCTRCGYCMPCPNGVDVPANLELYNHAIAFDDLAAARFRYGFALEQKQKASECAACGACLELCPQEIPIPEWMGRAGELLG